MITQDSLLCLDQRTPVLSQHQDTSEISVWHLATQQLVSARPLRVIPFTCATQDLARDPKAAPLHIFELCCDWLFSLQNRGPQTLPQQPQTLIFFLCPERLAFCSNSTSFCCALENVSGKSQGECRGHLLCFPLLKYPSFELFFYPLPECGSYLFCPILFLFMEGEQF